MWKKYLKNLCINESIIFGLKTILQFGFRQKFSTSHAALINITENIRQALDEGYIGCGIFVDLQKAFETMDHEILLSKLDYYGIRGTSNNWFKSYVSNRKQFVSINGYDFGLAERNCGVPQGSVLGHLLFLLYMNDVNQSIKFCKVHHFTDDTNFLYLGKSIKKLEASVRYFLSNFYFPSNDSPSKTMKNVFYFI